MKLPFVEKIVHEKEEYIRENTEQDIIRSCEQDRLYLQRIRTGDVDEILRLRAEQEETPFLEGSRLAVDPHKSYEYTVCAAVTMATYGAMSGGLDPVSAYALSDLYLQRLALCRDIEEMAKLHDEMELTFAEQVREMRAARSNASYVEKCKLFIDQHLGSPFTLDDIARALGVNKSYLSRRFAQDAGMRVMEYARKKRIEAAANMLKYSDKTISAIAANFCFPTQSHFGKLFKNIMGITPLKYRTANQIIEVRPNE
ncbi:MAG: AraC family transcriptional regulator [Oscillospiraceae bacterium]|nr:AraC family transcriptional regulator [Oscillospiraceae bacterium]